MTEEAPDELVLDELTSSTAWVKLSKDLRAAADRITVKQARFLVDTYYQVQSFRIESAAQEKAATAEQEPAELVGWLAASMKTLEGAIKSALDRYTDTRPEGRWAKSISGIGPVLSAGLLAHINIERAATAGAIWRFAGLDPTLVWGKGEKRPFNARLKVLCWKIGECFVRVQNREADVYGKVFAERKVQEWGHNLAGQYTVLAGQALERLKDRSTPTWAWNAGCFPATVAQEYLTLPIEKREAFLVKSKGAPGTGQAMLSPAHCHARARRYAVKLFLAHYHHVSWETHFHTAPPKPYVIEHGGHTHFIAPPNWPLAA